MQLLLVSSYKIIVLHIHVFRHFSEIVSAIDISIVPAVNQSGNSFPSMSAEKVDNAESRPIFNILHVNSLCSVFSASW